MRRHVTVPAIAAHSFPHGSPVRLVDGRAFYERNLEKIDGVTKRPTDAGAAVDHEAGDPLHVLTEGGQLSAMPDGTRWTEIRSGKVVP